MAAITDFVSKLAYTTERTLMIFSSNSQKFYQVVFKLYEEVDFGPSIEIGNTIL